MINFYFILQCFSLHIPQFLVLILPSYSYKRVKLTFSYAFQLLNLHAFEFMCIFILLLTILLFFFKQIFLYCCFTCKLAYPHGVAWAVRKVLSIHGYSFFFSPSSLQGWQFKIAERGKKETEKIYKLSPKKFFFSNS